MRCTLPHASTVVPMAGIRPTHAGEMSSEMPCRCALLICSPSHMTKAGRWSRITVMARSPSGSGNSAGARSSWPTGTGRCPSPG